ncbi:DUF4148 domain-containing protein [Noviherbaspirillum aridicola]|uniref:DUF4148 domain-containing protein n=1 Tax=Noviherbaspirillum aridicola TaxID=2849687 RepID=A0ABQ4PYU5_9BURK|nr:DUF4148 domain-containing protein [Noviherbaspirillum aridicola]GIZ50070.1 hypothetical protein NCCP691_00840 [Noviherbaspirillum aridicola]
MNTRKMIAAFAVFAAANTAFAAEWVEFTDFKSTKTRAEVMAELRQAQADGSYALARQEVVDPAASFTGTRTRAEVIAELEQSKADGTYAVLHQEFEGQYPAAGNGAGAGTRLAGKVRPANAN